MYVKSRAKVDSLARIKDIVFAWNVADTVYTGYFYFNEMKFWNILIKPMERRRVKKVYL